VDLGGEELKMGLNFSNNQLNIDCYMQKMLYTNLMVTTNQKPITDMQRKKEKVIRVHH